MNKIRAQEEGMVFHKLAALIRNRRGNVAITFAFCLFPLLIALGMSVDYSTAAKMRTKLNAVADSAALAAVTPAMMAQSDAASYAAAQNSFNAQATGLPDLQYNPQNLTITVSDSGLNRTVVVAYSAATFNQFGGILGKATISIGGSATASASAPPNIDFYLLLDSSPSMALPATTTGITAMKTATPSQEGGCAFACHQSNPTVDGLGNPNNEDNYAVARNLGLTLRIDNLRTAAQSLTTTAANSEATNNSNYRMAIYTFDQAFNSIAPLTSDLSAAGTNANNIQLLEVYKNNWLTAANDNGDADTDFDTAMSSMNALMPNPGGGSNAAGDTPQEVMFVVTDGVEDENVNGNRQQSVMNTAWCTTIKNRGIRIAVIYTTYFPLTGESWYDQYIAPIQSNIGPTMLSCATGGLYFEVSTNGDISAALNTLFQYAISTAHLTQ
jgi:Flp pilus assembly protein TadG